MVKDLFENCVPLIPVDVIRAQPYLVGLPIRPQSVDGEVVPFGRNASIVHAVNVMFWNGTQTQDSYEYRANLVDSSSSVVIKTPPNIIVRPHTPTCLLMSAHTRALCVPMCTLCGSMS